MRKTCLLLSALFITIISFGQSGMDEFNFGFEKISSGKKFPDKWFEWGSGYNLKLDTTIKHSGRASVLIEPFGPKKPNTFGCVAYSIPSKYDAREIEIKAYMKLLNVEEGPIGLMIRVDGESGTLGFENMQSKNIQGTMDWTPFTVKIPFPDYAKTIYIGALNSGSGKLWVDDFELLLDGVDIRNAKITKAKEYKADDDKEFDLGSKITDLTLTKQKIEDLDVLGKTWGFLKYYHPSIASGDLNWDYELFRVLPKILSAKNPKQRNAILNDWIANLGIVESSKNEDKVEKEIKLTPDLSWINPKTLGPELVKSLEKVKTAKRPTDHFYVGKVMGVGNPDFKHEKAYGAMAYPDKGFRLLSLYRYWNMIQYYFPYKNLIEEDWNKILPEYIPKFVSANNELEYKLSCLSLIARIHDTHANIWGMDNTMNEYKGLKHTPLEVTFVENKAVVTDYFDKPLGEKTGLKIGDVIESIGNKTIDEIIKEKLPLTPASNYPTQLRDIARSLLRTNSDELDITYWDGHEKKVSKVKAYEPPTINPYIKYQKRDTCFKILDNNIAYLYPGSVRGAFLPTIMEEVNKTKGLVIDFRCYPSDFIVFSLSEYLLPEAKSFVKFSNGSTMTPGLFTMTSEIKVGKSNPDYYKGKVVIIINEVTQSSAEYHTMAFRAAPNSTVIGSTTAGADGNVSRFVLPGGVNSMISGIGVYYPDGKETQRIGIVPDIEVKPTIQGIRDKRDELLEKAIEIINNN